MRIAIVDDDPEIINFLERIIKCLGHNSVAFNSGERVATALLRDTFDLLILDWTLPGKSGLEILEWLPGAVESPPPVIIMTNRTAKKDISDALNAGADDYIAKPEEESIVAARINALLRRTANSGSMDKSVTYGKYMFDRLNHVAVFDGDEIALTAKEFELADLLFRNGDRTLSRAYIMETIWRTSADLTTRTLDMHVSRLRSKLSLTPENGFRIFTVFGYGYRLETLGVTDQLDD